MFQYYLKSIIKTGDFYAIKKADEKLTELKVKAARRNIYLDIMRGVSYYKGVDGFIDRVKSGEVIYDCLSDVNNKSHIKRYMKEMDDIGINVISIPERYARQKGAVSVFDNPINILEKSFDPMKKGNEIYKKTYEEFKNMK